MSVPFQSSLSSSFYLSRTSSLTCGACPDSPPCPADLLSKNFGCSSSNSGRTTPLIEACVDSFASAQIAVENGADRLEVCGQLVIGGVTPSPALFQQIREAFSLPIRVLIRPRFGDFLYSSMEHDQIVKEIQLFRQLGADGVVIGELTPQGQLDLPRITELVREAKGMGLTLHRAFDMAQDPIQALEEAISLGFDTLLTSGQAPCVMDGLPLLKRLVHQAGGRLTILAGCGVHQDNILEIYQKTGLRAFHTTGKKEPLQSGMLYRQNGVSMGLPCFSEYEIWQTDSEEFRACADAVHSLI